MDVLEKYFVLGQGGEGAEGHSDRAAAVCSQELALALGRVVSHRGGAEEEALVRLLEFMAQSDPALPKSTKWPGRSDTLMQKSQDGYVTSWWPRRLGLYLYCIFCALINRPWRFIAANSALAREHPGANSLPRSCAAEMPNSGTAPLKQVSHPACGHSFDLSKCLQNMLEGSIGSWEQAHMVPDLHFLKRAHEDARYSLAEWMAGLGYTLREGGVALRTQLRFLGEDSILVGLAEEDEEGEDVGRQRADTARAMGRRGTGDGSALGFSTGSPAPLSAVSAGHDATAAVLEMLWAEGRALTGAAKVAWITNTFNPARDALLRGATTGSSPSGSGGGAGEGAAGDPGEGAAGGAGEGAGEGAAGGAGAVVK